MFQALIGVTIGWIDIAIKQVSRENYNNEERSDESLMSATRLSYAVRYKRRVLTVDLSNFIAQDQMGAGQKHSLSTERL